MGRRLLIWGLTIAALAQVINLWPMPEERTERTQAFWRELKAKAEMSSTQDKKAKAQAVALAKVTLEDRTGMLYRARLDWSLWLASIVVTALAAIAVLRQWRWWRWLAVAAAAMFFWLQEPLSAFSVFNVDDNLNLTQTLPTLSQHPVAFWRMFTQAALVPSLLAAIVAYVLFTGIRKTPTKEPANAP